jgi:hypothetical protein
LQEAGIGEVFGGTVGQDFLGQRASLNFRVGQDIRGFRVRGEDKKHCSKNAKE